MWVLFQFGHADLRVQNQYLETGTLAITQGCIYFGKIWSVWQINDSLYVYELCNIWTIKYFYHGLEMGEE